jgi:hypothetical protein
MSQRYLKDNFYGIIGLPILLLMLGIAFFLNWNISWWYFIAAIILYFGAVISLSREEDRLPRTISGLKIIGAPWEEQWLIIRWLLGCHVALLFLAVGLALHFPNYIGPFGLPISGEITRAFYFIASVLGGLAIPFMLLRGDRFDGITINPHGLVALLQIFLMFGVAFFYKWSFDWLYWLYFIAAIALYVAASVPYFVLKYSPGGRRASLGKHIAFFFLIVGFGLQFKNAISIIGFFIASIAAGLVIPYLLIRDPY